MTLTFELTCTECDEVITPNMYAGRQCSHFVENLSCEHADTPSETTELPGPLKRLMHGIEVLKLTVYISGILLPGAAHLYQGLYSTGGQ